MTRFQYLLLKHAGRAVAEGGQIIMIGVVALIVLAQLPRLGPPDATAATLAFVGALAIVVVGRLMEFWGEVQTADPDQDAASGRSSGSRG